MRLVDQKPRRIKGDIDEIDLAKVKIGMPARIKVPAVRPLPYAAVIERVVPFVNTTKEQERTSRIELRITESDQGVPVGASAEIEIIAGAKDQVTAVPARTVLGNGNQKFVFILTDGKVKKNPVGIGIGNYERTEILTGLKEGDLVLIPGNVDLVEGMKVTPEIQPWPETP